MHLGRKRCLTYTYLGTPLELLLAKYAYVGLVLSLR